MAKVELNEEMLDNITGGYVGFDYDINTGIGVCGLGEKRNYQFTDNDAFHKCINETAGWKDADRMRELLRRKIITKIG